MQKNIIEYIPSSDIAATHKHQCMQKHRCIKNVTHGTFFKIRVTPKYEKRNILRFWRTSAIYCGCPFNTKQVHNIILCEFYAYFEKRNILRFSRSPRPVQDRAYKNHNLCNNNASFSIVKCV